MKSSLRHARLHLSSRTKPKNTYICIQCRINTQLHQFSTSGTNGAPQERARPIDFTERLRRRIWGTDTPPGPPPIYRKLSPEEEALAAAEFDELETENAIARDTATEVARQQEAGQYKPAEDWTGLEKIGGPKGWWEEAWDRENVYQGFLTEGVLERDELGDVGGMVRRVAVEIIALKQAGLPLYEGAKAKWLTEEFMEDIDIVRDDGGGFVLREHAPDIIDELLESLQKNEDVEELLDDEDDGEDEANEDDGDEVQDPEQQRILEELHAEEDAAAAELEMQEEAEEGEEIRTVATTKVHDPVYLELPLADLAFKFAVCSFYISIPNILIEFHS